MKIEKININDINLSSYNPREIDNDNKNKLKKSINEFGLVDPIIINNNTKDIIGGHQRYKILKENNKNQKLNYIKMGDIGWVFTDDDFKIKNDESEKALNIALNKISGSFNDNKLNEILEDLKINNFDVELTGFDEDFDRTKVKNRIIKQRLNNLVFYIGKYEIIIPESDYNQIEDEINEEAEKNNKNPEDILFERLFYDLDEEENIKGDMDEIVG